MFEEITINTYYMFIVIVVLNVSFRLGYDKKKENNNKSGQKCAVEKICIDYSQIFNVWLSHDLTH